MSSPLRVIVVGAGLSGLALAQGLKKNGIDYVVVDRESAPRDRNWGVTIAWSTPLIARLLPQHLFERLKECQPDSSLDNKAAGLEHVIIRDGLTGETLTEPHFPGVRRLNIQKTRRIWSEGLNVKFGKTVTDIELDSDGITAHFHDGTSEKGSVLIGSDGGGSWVRRWMMGDQGVSEVLPYTFLNFSFRYPADRALRMEKMMNPNVDVACHPKSMYAGIFMLDKPDLHKPETWVFYVLATWPIQDEDYEGEKNMVDELRRRMDNWADPYASAVEWIPADTRAKAIQLRIWGPPEAGWDNRGGKVTLSGDAAHSMTFHRGQGANNAICDSDKFVAAMIKVKNDEKSLREAVDEYDAEMMSRGRAEVEIGRVQCNAFHDHAKFLESPVVKHGIKPLADTQK